jgi:RimJ/RimL family protein N-acetyltransferase
MNGNSVSLRPLIEEDLSSYFNWINNRELVQYNSSYKPISIFEHCNWFRSVSLQKDIAIFSIVENQTNRLIGTCSLRNINLLHKNAELQIRIGESEYQNQGFGKEAIQLLVDYGFNDLNLIRIYLHVFSDNQRAIKAYQYCNFEIEGLLKKAAFINGTYKDIHVMAILR